MQTELVWLSYIDGEFVRSGDTQPVLSPYRQTAVANAIWVGRAEMDRALRSAVRAHAWYSKTDSGFRARLLSMIVDGIEARRKEFVEAIILEAGKPRLLAETEVTRALTTFRVSRDEALRWPSRVVETELAGDPAASHYTNARSRFFPKGVVLGITPFNFPLNLVAHKVGPALASGNAIVIKAAPQTPGGATLLAQVFQEVSRSILHESPELSSVLQVVHCSNEVASTAVSDARVAVLSFTGSAEVGWKLRDQAREKHVVLELGGNAASIVLQGADLKRAAERLTLSGYGYAGQTCISVQRVYVDDSIFENFVAGFARSVAALSVGDPEDAKTIVGPVIDRKAKDRIESWIKAARDNGAEVLFQGKAPSHPLFIAPVLLTGVSRDLPLVQEEVFGPVVVIERVPSCRAAIDRVNDSKYGLQASLFSDPSAHDLIEEAFAGLEVGGLIVNDSPSFRSEAMPYGGIKGSGLGREGIRFAMEEFSELRTRVDFQG